MRAVLSFAARKCFPELRLIGGHSLGAAFHYFLSDATSDEDLKVIENKMREIIDQDLPIDKCNIPWTEAKELFIGTGQNYALSLIETRVTNPVEVIKCAGDTQLSVHELYPSAGSLKGKHFHLLGKIVEPKPDAGAHEIAKGFLLCFNSPEYQFEPTLVQIQREHKIFGSSTEVHCFGDLNRCSTTSRARKDFILNAEFRQERLMAQIVNQVVQRRSDPVTRVRLIAIAGPTSSGKTTFATKLSLYLKNEGLMSTLLSVDHYYLPLDRQPKYQARKMREDVDYDSIESMDVELVNEHLSALIRDEEVLTPVYNMKTGFRDEPGNKFKLPDSKFGGEFESLLLIEGIHALNPEYTKMVPSGNVFKIYICPQTVLQVDDSNTVKASHQRLLRRMSRDYLFRGHTASRTLSMWDNVRKGEKQWIFPFQNHVDFQMNSGMEYELAVLKTHVEPLLAAVPPTDPNYGLASELLQMLSKLNAWPDSDVPGTSILREFIGMGLFDCH